MEISHIKEFIVLAEICNYGRAADALFISQSTLFNHIRALETEINLSLFDRQGRNIVLSEYGQIFLPYARTIVAASEDFADALKENKEEKTKIIRIVTQYRITDLIRQFRKQYPRFAIHFLDSKAPAEMLDDGSCELAFIRDVSEEEKEAYNVLPYVTDSIVAAVFSSHPLANRKSVTLGELKSEDFVMISQRQKRECLCMDICKKAGFIPKVAMTAVNGNEAAKLVNSEVGISLFLKQTLISEAFNNLVLLDLEPEIKCTISLCWRKDKELSPGAKAFVKFVKGKLENRG